MLMRSVRMCPMYKTVLMAQSCEWTGMIAWM
jgi:hypothetical protein